MPDSRITDERLRSWLDANQVQRERLCAQLLPLLGQYSDVEPRRPKGGPDGARDIQAVYNRQLSVWGAVGFRNSAKDDNEDKSWVRKKFKDDLQSAQEQYSDLKGFVFFTNVDLTPGEQDELKEHAKSKAIAHIDIFIRERLRLVLDSIEGWGYRLQFLEIEMSREEQLAFIDRFGARLESLLERQRVEIREQQRAIDDKLRRIEFLHESTRPIRGAVLFVDLNRPYTPEELGHFRILLEVLSLQDPDPHPTLWLAVRDGYVTATYHDASVLLYGETSIAWSRNPDEMLQQTNVATHRGTQSGRIEGGAYLYHRGPFHSLAEFDRTTVSVFVTKPLLDKIAYVGLIVNDFLLVGAPRDQIIIPQDLEEAGREPFATWPVSLSEEEQRVAWVELYIKGPDAHIMPDLEHPPFLLRHAIPWGIDYRGFTPINVLVGEQETDESGA